MEKKKVHEWFELVKDDEVKTQLLSNMEFEEIDFKTESLSEAIKCGFEWSGTPEGHNYWSNICDNAHVFINTSQAIEKP